MSKKNKKLAVRTTQINEKGRKIFHPNLINWSKRYLGTIALTRENKIKSHKILSIIVTLFISLFILSAIFTIEDSLKKELNDNAKSLLGGDVEIDYNRVQGNLELVDKVREFTTVSSMIEFTTMVSGINDTNQSLFTRIKTVDKKYPLYGEVIHEPAGAMDRIHREKNTIIGG